MSEMVHESTSTHPALKRAPVPLTQRARRTERCRSLGAKAIRASSPLDGPDAKNALLANRVCPFSVNEYSLND